jgi:hypothetical protein
VQVTVHLRSAGFSFVSRLFSPLVSLPVPSFHALPLFVLLPKHLTQISRNHSGDHNGFTLNLTAEGFF